MNNGIVSGVAGVVATVDTTPGSGVSKGAKLITVHPDGSFQIEVLVSELDLNAIKEGDTVAIEFNWDTEGALRTTGTVDSISRVNATAEGGASSMDAEYSAYISFESSEDVRLGMSVVVYTMDAEADAEEAPAE